MVKKVFDILPPEEIRQPAEKKEKKEVFLAEKRKWTLPKVSLPSFEDVTFKKPAIFFLVLILIGIFSYFALPKAEIVIQPETEISTFEAELTIDEKLSVADFPSSIIPGEFFEVEKQVSEEFSSSGITFKEEKAEGTIRVYNAYSTSSQVLVATTRFVSTEGKLFRSIERVTIPGGHYEGGKLVSGFLDIRVRADQPGEEFNIESSTFSIPGFVGTPRYTYFYGKSFQPMLGGLKKEVPKVTQEDLDQAKNILIKRAEKEGEISLNEKISSEFILLEEAREQEILELFSSAQAEETGEKFIFRVKTRFLVLAFKEKLLEDFVEQFISFRIPAGKKVYRKDLKISYTSQSVDLKLGKIILSLTATAKIYSDIDENNLKKALAGKSQNETQLYLENHPQIIKAVIKFWPFWVKKVPQKEEKIKIELRID